ncbi:MAG TPA: CDP-alcohol phosphatidyltransferase family protein [Candidatus Limnocylindrales bacterium]
MTPGPAARGSIVSPELRARVRRAGEPVALALGRLGFTPNALTLTGFLITTVAAALAAAGLWLAAGVVVLLGGVFDLFDGALARATGRVSAVGAFLDSVFDRWSEGIVFVGIAAGAVVAGFGLGAILSAAAMASAFMVSYTRAKSEALGFTTGTGMAQVGLAPREVRLVVLAVGLVGAGLAGGVGPITAGGSSGDAGGTPWLGGSLAIIAVFATITVIQRIVHALGAAGHQS